MHVLERAFAAGLDEVLVVTGYRHADIEAFLDDVRGAHGYAVEALHNPQWQAGQHTSVRTAAARLDGPFILMMADHLFDASIVADLMAPPRADAGLVLAVDARLANPHVDLDDVTRVLCEGDRIVAIGKLMADYNAYDTGLFRCTPAIFEALERTGKPVPSLSDGVQILADEGRARSLDIGARFWIDVDDRRMHALAEQALGG